MIGHITILLLFFATTLLGMVIIDWLSGNPVLMTRQMLSLSISTALTAAFANYYRERHKANL